jgi:hypothetical protein
MSYQKTHSVTFTTRTGKTAEVALWQDLTITVGTEDLPLIEAETNEKIFVQTSNERGEGVISAYYNTSFVREPKDDVYDIYVALSKTVLNKPYLRVIIDGTTIFQGSPDKETFEFSNVYEAEVLNVSFKSPLALIQEQDGVFLHRAIDDSSNTFHLADSTDTSKQKVPVGDLINTFMVQKVDPGAGTDLKIFTNLTVGTSIPRQSFARNTFVNPFYVASDEPWSKLLTALMTTFFMTLGYSTSQGDYIICEYNPAEDYNDDFTLEILAENSSGLRTITTSTITPQTITKSDEIEADSDKNVDTFLKRFREIVATQESDTITETAPTTFDNFKQFLIEIPFKRTSTLDIAGIEDYEGSSYSAITVEHSVTSRVTNRLNLMLAELKKVYLFEQQLVTKLKVLGIIDPALPFRYRPYDHEYVVYQMRMITAVINYVDETTELEAIKVRDISRPIGDINGCVLHLRADEGVTTTSTGRVTAWADQSGEGHDATEETSGAGPTLQYDRLNGRPVLSFLGGYLTFPELSGANAERDWIIVARSNASAGTDCIIQEGDGSSGFLRILDNLDLTTQSDSVSFNDDIDELQFDLIEVNTAFDNDLELATITLNGTPLTRSGTASTIVDTVGKGFIGADENGSGGLRLWEGLIAEVMCFQFGITATERGYIRDYLKAKYKLNLA